MRAFHATVLEVIYAERRLPEYASREIIPVFDCRSMNGMDQLSDTHHLVDERAYWARNSGAEPHTFPDQEYLRPRFASLVKAYVSGGMPDDWRLAEALLPFTGDELGIRLTVLLKPVHGTLKSVYSVVRYG